MAIPVVTAGADVSIGVALTNPSGYGMNLSATATNGPIIKFEWTILYAPTGGEAARNSGSFTSGIAIGQNVTFTAPAGIAGSYIVQCIATNASGESNPFVDGALAQQNLIIADADGLEQPGDFQFNYGDVLRNALLFLKTGAGGGGGDTAKVSNNDTTPSFLNSKLTVANGLAKAIQNGGGNETLQFSPTYGTGANEIAEGNDARFPTTDQKGALLGTSGTPSAANPYVTNQDGRLTDARTPLAHSLAGAEHSAVTVAQLNAKITDANVDDSAASRPPNGSASGDLGGTYPSPTVVALTETDGPTSLVAGAILDGELLARVGATLVGQTKRNLNASAAPTATDDSTAGYSEGSLWVDTTNDKPYICVDASATAAIWTDVTGGGGGFTAYEEEFTSTATLETFTLSTAMAVNGNTPSGFNVIGAYVNGVKQKFTGGTPGAREYDTPANNQIRIGGMNVGDDIEIVFGV